MKAVLILATTVLVAASYAAVPASAQTQPTPPTDVGELTNMFVQLCIKDFPDASATDQFVKSKLAREMSPSEVQRYLHDDPGSGWYIKTNVALYAVTFERPPYHTCAIRRMTPEGAAAADIGAAAGAAKTYAASIGGRAVSIPPNHSSTANGPDVLSFGIGVLDATGKPSDSFGIFLSNYHHRIPEPWVADGTPGVGVEVRMTRQVMDK